MCASARLRGARAAAVVSVLAVVSLCGSACALFGGREPPPVRGVVLVLAAGFEGGPESRRTPALERLTAVGRSFDAAYAPDPDPIRARAAIVDALPAALRAAGVAVAGLGDAAVLPLDASALEVHVPVADAAGMARLEGWIRGSTGRFVVIAGLGAPAAPRGAPATLAGAFEAPLPSIAVADLGFSARPGATPLRPAAWADPARQRARAVELERALESDRALQALLEAAARASPDAATIVVGDPPPDKGLHGRLERGDALFDDTLRSALVVAAPGLARPGRASSRLVSTLDAPPTLLALLGLPAEPGLPGTSLMPLLADASGTGRSEVVSSVPRRAGRLGRSVRTLRYRYNEWPDGSLELYDHDKDAGEHANLARRPEHAATLAALRQTLAEPQTNTPQAVAASRPAARGPAAGGRARPPRARSAVLIVVDDLNTRLAAWGAAVKTPAIDRLAARGVRFEHAFAQVAMCNPSRVSMLTGWSPERTGVWQNEDPPRPAGAVPLQELLAAHGALTVSVGKIYHSPADFRWDVREEHPELVEERDPSAAGEGLSGLWVKAPGGDLDQPDGRRARRAAAILERRRGRPLFLALGLVRPHLRWVAPSRYFELYPPRGIAPSPFPADDLADVPPVAVKTQPLPLPGLALLGREPPALVADAEFRREATSAYQACVSFADAQVGVVLDALDRHDLWRDTVVVLAGDNGFHLGEHGGLLRKDTLFEEALRVPLIVAAPGLPRPGAVARTPVELLDVYPTLVELLGLEAPVELDGQSLVPLLEDPDAEGRGYARSWRRVQPPERGYSLRTERLRYTLWPDGSEELYDRRAAAVESENLAALPAWAEQKARLRARLEALVAPPAKGR